MNPLSSKFVAILVVLLGSSYSTSVKPYFDLILGYENKDCTGRVTYLSAKPSSHGSDAEKTECTGARKRIRGATKETINLILKDTEGQSDYFFQSDKEMDGFNVLGSCMAAQGFVATSLEKSFKYILEELLDGTPLVKRLGYANDDCCGSPIVEEISVVFMYGPIIFGNDHLFMKLLPSNYKVLKGRLTHRVKDERCHERLMASVLALHNPIDFADQTQYGLQTSRIDLVLEIKHSYFDGTTGHGIQRGRDNFIIEHYVEPSDRIDHAKEIFLNERIAAQGLVDIGNGLMVPVNKCRFMGGFKDIGSDIFFYHVNADGQKVLQRQAFFDDHCKISMGPAGVYYLRGKEE